MKQQNVSTGRLGEEIAKHYLEKKGYKIVEQNARSKFGEIDLVCQKGKELIIVEVRTKIGDSYGTPEESLTKKKLRKLWLNARSYAVKKKWPGSVRIDAVCIVLRPLLAPGKQWPERIDHYENII
jgi:putative endonuclease